jgi:hypothetical protein
VTLLISTLRQTNMIEVFIIITLMALFGHTVSWFLESSAGDFRNWVIVSGFILFVSFAVLAVLIAIS